MLILCLMSLLCLRLRMALLNWSGRTESPLGSKYLLHNRLVRLITLRVPWIQLYPLFFECIRLHWACMPCRSRLFWQLESHYCLTRRYWGVWGLGALHLKSGCRIGRAQSTAKLLKLIALANASRLFHSNSSAGCLLLRTLSLDKRCLLEQIHLSMGLCTDSVCKVSLLAPLTLSFLISVARTCV